MKILVYLPLPAEGVGAKREAYPLALTDASLLTGGKPQFLPDLSHRYLLYVGVAIQLHNTGKKIAPRFVHRYCDGLAPAAMLVDADELERCRQSGTPYTAAVSFDFNLARGGVAPFSTEAMQQCILEAKAGEGIVHWSTNADAADWRERMAAMSRQFTFRTGDLVIPMLGSPIEVTKDTHVRLTLSCNTLQTNDNETNEACNIIYDYNIK